MGGGEQHTAALETHHLARRQVDDGDQRLANELLRLVPLVDAGEDLAVGAGAVVKCEAQQLIALLHGFAGFDLDDAEVGSAEGVEIDLLLRQRLGLQRGERGLLLRLLNGLQLGERLFHVDAREDGLALVDGDACAQAAPFGGAVPIATVCRRANLREDLLAGGGNERREQDGADADGLEEVVHHTGKARAVGLVLGEHPRRGLVDILVRTLNDLEDGLQTVLELELLHLGLVLAAQGGGCRDEIGVELTLGALDGQRAAEILLDHGGCAGDEVAEVVGKIDVDGVDEQLIAEIAVGAEREGTQQEETQRVHAEALGKHIGIDDIALGFAHLAAVHDEPAVAVDVLGQRHAHAHEHRGPDDGVEADDLLADKVDVGGPELIVIVVLFVHEAESGAVVEQRIDPDIDDVAGVEVHRNAPGEARAGNAQILKAGLDEVVHHLVHAAGGLEEICVLEQVLHAVGVLAQLEEVGLLFSVLHLTPAVGALAVHELALGPEALAGLAVFADVLALVDVAVVVHLPEDLLDGLDVVIVGGADEAVVGDVHQLPQIEDALLAADDVVHELLRGHARGLGLVLDLLTVLVRSGQEHHVIAGQALVARHRVGRHRAVGVADVQLVRRVVNGRGDIESFLFHGYLPLFLPAPNESGA